MHVNLTCHVIVNLFGFTVSVQNLKFILQYEWLLLFLSLFFYHFAIFHFHFNLLVFCLFFVCLFVLSVVVI